jgi:uncharacterized protein YejL (UPF0352 family)
MNEHNEIVKLKRLVYTALAGLCFIVVGSMKDNILYLSVRYAGFSICAVSLILMGNIIYALIKNYSLAKEIQH